MADISQMSPEQALAALIDAAVRRAMVETRTHVPATVLAFKRTPRAEVSVQVDMKARLRTGETVEIPRLDRVPVLWPAGGGWTFDADLVVGDQVLLEVFDRDISEWLVSGGTVDPATGMLHAITCCTALAVSIRSDAKVAKATPGPGALLIGRESGAPPWVRLGTLPAPKITLQAPTIALGENATLGVARQTDPVAADAAWVTWFAALASFTGIPVPAGVPLGRILTASTIVKAL